MTSLKRDPYRDPDKHAPGGGGVLPYKRLIGMCRWMGSHFHAWSDYNGVAFSIELLEWCTGSRGDVFVVRTSKPVENL